MSLFDKVFREDNASINKLMNDKDIRELILSSNLKLPSNKGDLIGKRAQEAFMVVAYNQDFASADEAVYVAHIITKNLRNLDILPLITEHGNFFGAKYKLVFGEASLPLAHRCLVSLSFFKEKMEKLHHRYAAPSPDFYRSVSQAIFSGAGMQDLAEHHKLWESHLSKELMISRN